MGNEGKKIYESRMREDAGGCGVQFWGNEEEQDDGDEWPGGFHAEKDGIHGKS